MFVDFNILNQLGSPSINSNTFANRPAAGQTGRLFVSTDTFEIYRDNGTTWDLIGGPGSSTITGTGTATQVAYFTSSQAIGSSSNLYWDNTNIRLGIGTSTPGTRLDIHGTGIMQHINATGATANSLMAFQRTGTNVWRLGDQYNGGSNYFELHNTALANNAIQIDAATNKSIFTSVQNYVSGLARANYFDYTLNLPNGTTISSPNAVTTLGSTLNLNIAGSATLPNGARSGMDVFNGVNFTSAGTFTINQASTIRAFSNLTSGWAFNGSAIGTITHLAGMRVLFPTNSGTAINVTTNYGLLINDQTANTGTITYTNRWGIYQEGASDTNYFAGTTLVGTTVNSGYKFDVSGSGRFTDSAYFATVAGNKVGIGTSTPDRILTVYSGTADSRVLLQTQASGTGIASGFDLNIVYSAYGAYAQNDAQVWNYENAALVFATNNTERARFDNTGVFAINETSPYSGAKLVVKQASIYDGLYINNSTSANNSISLYHTGTIGAIDVTYLGIGGYTPLTFWTGGLERLRINTNGNTLIGTTTDNGSKLRVAGNTYIDGKADIGLVNILSSATSSAVSASCRVQTAVEMRGYEVTMSALSPTSGSITIPKMYGLITNQPNVQLNVTVTDSYGLYVGRTDDPVSGGVVTNKYGIIVDNNAGPVGIGVVAPVEKLEVNGAIKTAAPTTGTAAAWKLGSRVAATVVVNTTEYIEVDIGGTLYKLATVT